MARRQDVDWSARDAHGNTPLHHLVSIGFQLAVETALRSIGSNGLANAVNNDGATPLSVAARNCNDRAVHSLLNSVKRLDLNR